MGLFEFGKTYKVPSGHSIWPHIKKHFPFESSMDKLKSEVKDRDDAEAWADEAFTNAGYISVAYRFFFKTKTDAMQFKLAWCLP